MAEDNRQGNDKPFSQEYLENAHKHTFANEEEIRSSSVCTCFYCGYQFGLRDIEEIDWWEEAGIDVRTLSCPICGIDAVLGDASSFPITDPDFIKACTEYWFDGYSKISQRLQEVK
ncbi:MAG: hypothetical protein ACQEQU_02900 [Spirochaetota bacterium]